MHQVHVVYCMIIIITCREKLGLVQKDLKNWLKEWQKVQDLLR